MAIEGYIEYQRREFCKDVKCPVQLELNAQEPGSKEYESGRRAGRTAGIPPGNFTIG
jgi:hypothetical protein